MEENKKYLSLNEVIKILKDDGDQKKEEVLEDLTEKIVDLKDKVS